MDCRSSWSWQNVRVGIIEDNKWWKRAGVKSRMLTFELKILGLAFWLITKGKE